MLKAGFTAVGDSSVPVQDGRMWSEEVCVSRRSMTIPEKQDHVQSSEQPIFDEAVI